MFPPPLLPHPVAARCSHNRTIKQKGSDPEYGLLCRRRAHAHARRLLGQQGLPPHLVRCALGGAGAQGRRRRARQHVLRRASLSYPSSFPFLSLPGPSSTFRSRQV